MFLQVEMLESLVEREVEERSKLLQSFERAKKELNLLKLAPSKWNRNHAMFGSKQFNSSKNF